MVYLGFTKKVLIVSIDPSQGNQESIQPDLAELGPWHTHVHLDDSSLDLSTRLAAQLAGGMGYESSRGGEKYLRIIPSISTLPNGLPASFEISISSSDGNLPPDMIQSIIATLEKALSYYVDVSKVDE